MVIHPSAPSYLKATCNFPVKQEILIDPELEKLLYPLDGPSDNCASILIHVAVVTSPLKSEDT